MNFYTYGNPKNPAILLIHGAGWSYWLYQRQAQALSENYYVILPELNGHGNANLSEFVSSDHSAQEIIAYLHKEEISTLHLLSGVSLGGQVAIAMLTRQPDIASRAIIESALCVSAPTLAKFSKVINKSCGKLLFSKGFNGWALKYMPKNMRLPKDIQTLYLDTIEKFSTKTLDTIYDTYCYYHLAPSLQATTAELSFWYGTKEDKLIKQSAMAFSKHMEAAGKTCEIVPLQGYRHGQISSYLPEEWLKRAKLL